MAEFQNTIDLLGDEVVASYIADRSIVNFSDDILNNVGNYAFYNCPALTSIDLPNVTSIGSNAFYNCSALTSIDLPNVKIINDAAFYGCSALTSIDLPNVTSINSSAFYGCSALTSIDLPNVTSINSSAFYNCPALTSIDLPNVTSIGNAAFYACGKLSIIILRSETICTLSATTALEKTQFDTQLGCNGGTVYVPQALIESYKTATNWSSIYAKGHCNFVAIEGSEYE